MLVIASLSAGKKSVKIKISLFEKITKFFLAFSLSLCYSTSDIISNFCLETDRPLRTWCRGQVLFVWDQSDRNRFGLAQQNAAVFFCKRKEAGWH